MNCNLTDYRFFKGRGNRGRIFIYNTQGQLMAKYRMSGNKLKLNYMPIYEGTKRIGILEPDSVRWKAKRKCYIRNPITGQVMEVPCGGWGPTDDIGDSMFRVGLRSRTIYYKANRKYELTDHLGNVRIVIRDQRIPVPDSSNQNVVAYYKPLVDDISDYYPYGWVKYRTNYHFGANAGSLLENWDSTRGTYYTLYRLLDARIARWYQVEPKWEEYAMLSPYVVNSGNPIIVVDVLGDSIWIEYNGKSYLYMGGKVYDNEGNEITQLDGFLKQAVETLNKLRDTESFGNIVKALEVSRFNYTIKYGDKSSFEENSRVRASILANLIINVGVDSTKQMLPKLQEQGVVGSGGTIYWNPQSETPIFTTSGIEAGGKGRSITGLAHELAHAYSAMLGIVDFRKAEELGADQLGENITKNEWIAVYFENKLRKELQMPLRTHYGGEIYYEKDPVTGKLRVGGKPYGKSFVRQGDIYLPKEISKLLEIYGIK